MIRILLLAGLLLLPSFVDAATYYIDNTSGLDSRTSTQAQSKTTPWKHLRCMATATGNGVTSPQSAAGASGYIPVAGDIFVLKGGEIWHNADFPCTWNWSGTSVSRITVTVDQTWFTGGSWSRPKFAADGAVIVGPIRPAGIWAVNAFLDLNAGNFGVSYVTFDNIEMLGFSWQGDPAFNTCSMIIGANSTNVTLDHLYIHGWVHGTYASGATDSFCKVIQGSSNPPYNLGSILQNSVIDNNDGSGGGDSLSVYLWPNILNNVITHIPNAVIQNGSGEIAGNDLSFAPASFDLRECPPGSGLLCVHPNLLETLGASSAFTVYIHDNKIHDSTFAGTETSFLANLGAGQGNIYYWNNVLYNLVGNNMVQLDQQNTPPNFFVWNNTIHARDGRYCFKPGHTGATPATIKIQNNHCITTMGITVDPALVATSLTVLPNTVQTPAQAAAQGYTNAQTPYVYTPTDAGDATVAAQSLGVNLTANCTGTLASLCTDTAYGSTVIGSLNAGPGRAVRARLSSGNWETGAYNFSGAKVSPTWFHFDQEFIDSNIGTATTTYPYFTGYKLWPQAAGSTPPVLAPATITALSPGGGSQTKYFMLHYPAAGGTTMANGLPSPAQNYFDSGQTRVNPLFSVINGNQTEMRNLTYSSGSTTRIWWDMMPEWDGLGGYWLPTTVGLFESGTRAGNYTGFRTYISTNWTPLWTILQTAQATRGFGTASVAVWNANTHYIYEWGADMVLLERVIDSVGDLATGTAFIRGAGTQYGKPWGIDLSHYRVSAGSKGTTEFDQATGGLIGGWSTATTKRHLYLSYMAGPNDILSEAITLRYADTSLNPLALTLQSFGNFTVAHPTRGTPVVPIALIMDHDHGFVPRHWVFSDAPLSLKAVWYQKLAYNVGDHATNNLFVQLWPEHWRYGQTLGWNGGTTIVGSADWDAYGAWITGHDTRPFEPMPNSTYGDLFDVLLSDAPMEALNRYNVVMPIGNFAMTAGWRTMMTDYATLGGIVVLNMSQVTAADEALLGVTLGSTTTATSSKWGAESNLTESTYTYRIVTPTTATVIATNPANGNPLITMRTLGAGKVYFVAPNYMQDNGNVALLNLSKRLLQDLTETYRQGWAEGLPVDFLTTQGTGFKTVTVSNNSAATWSGNVKFKQAAPTSAVEWLTNTALSYSVASGVTTMAVTVPAFDVRIFALTGGSTDVLPPASPTNVRVQ